MPKFNVPIYRQIPLTVTGNVIVEADNVEEAEEKAIKIAEEETVAIEYYSEDPSADVSEAVKEGNFLPNDIQAGEVKKV